MSPFRCLGEWLGSQTQRKQQPMHGKRKESNALLQARVQAKRSAIRKRIAQIGKPNHTGSGQGSKPPPGGFGGNGKLVGLGSGTPGRPGAPRSRGSPAPPRVPLKTGKATYRSHALKPPIVVATRHADASKYASAASRFKSQNSKLGQSLNESQAYHGASFDEKEFMHGKDRHLVLTGRELLFDLSTTYPAVTTDLVVPAGGRLGVTPISPQWLGGRLQLMSEQFQQHKCKFLRLLFEPDVAATRPGSIMMYFNNDVGVEILVVGSDETAHAATHSSFVETPVWQPAVLDIKPEDAISRFVDQASGDVRFETQGLVVVEAGHTLTIEAGVSLGNIYVEYEVEFFGEVLDYVVPIRAVSTGACIMDSTYTGSPSDYAAIRGVVSPSVPPTSPANNGFVKLEFSDFPPGVTTGADPNLTDWVYCGWFLDGDITTEFGASAAFVVTDTGGVYTWDTGRGFFMRFEIAQAGVTQGMVIGTFYGDLASAGLSDAAGEASTTHAGEFAWWSAVVPSEKFQHFKGYWSQLK